MITYGFFNAIDNDRLYDAESFNKFFEGLIPSNGVFANVDDGFVVRPSTGLNVTVGRGKAIVNNHWVRSNSVEIITLDTPHNLFGRYDMISLQWNASDRTVSLVKTTGTPASTPVRPTPNKSITDIYEIVLAYIYVGANATQINSALIRDMRHNTSYCGIVTGLIEQIDTSELYKQYTTQFEELSTDMKAWQTQQQSAFEQWMSTLTEQLQVNTYIERLQSNWIVTDEQYYIQIPDVLLYSTNDILNVYVNGILCVENVDYIIQENEVEGGYMVRFLESLQASSDTTQIITFHCYKSQIGVRV